MGPLSRYSLECLVMEKVPTYHKVDVDVVGDKLVKVDTVKIMKMIEL